MPPSNWTKTALRLLPPKRSASVELLDAIVLSNRKGTVNGMGPKPSDARLSGATNKHKAPTMECANVIGKQSIFQMPSPLQPQKKKGPTSTRRLFRL